MFKLSRITFITGNQRPAIRPGDEGSFASGNDGLDGEAHAGEHLDRERVVIYDSGSDERLCVKAGADAVAREIGDDIEALFSDESEDGAADLGNGLPRPTLCDPNLHCLKGGVSELL